MTLTELFNQSGCLSEEIKSFLKKSTYSEYNDCSGLDIDFENADDLQKWDEIQRIACELEKSVNMIDRICRPISLGQKIHINSRGRYETADGTHEYTCGDSIEYLSSDDFDERTKWKFSSVEARNGKYYIVAEPMLEMEGLLIRRRKR